MTHATDVYVDDAIREPVVVNGRQFTLLTRTTGYEPHLTSTFYFVDRDNYECIESTVEGWDGDVKINDTLYVANIAKGCVSDKKGVAKILIMSLFACLKTKFPALRYIELIDQARTSDDEPLSAVLFKRRRQTFYETLGFRAQRESDARRLNALRTKKVLSPNDLNFNDIQYVKNTNQRS